MLLKSGVVHKDDIVSTAAGGVKARWLGKVLGEIFMGSKSWKKDRAKERVDSAIAALPISKIEIKEYVR